MYNCTPTPPRVFSQGTRQQLAVPKQPCLTPPLSLSLCSNQAFQNSRVSVSLCNLVRIPLCVSLQQLAVPKQPCLQPHCLCLSLQLGPNTLVSVSQIPLCLVATTQSSKATLSTTTLSVSVFAAWSEYPCVCVSDTLVSRCNNSEFQSNPVYNHTVCVCLCSLVRIPLCLCLRYPCVSLQQLRVPKQPCLQPHCLCLSLQLGPNTLVSVSQIPLCLVATTQSSKATLSTTTLSVSVFAAWSEYPCVCVSDTLVSRCNNTVCVSLQLGPNTRCNNWPFRNNPVYNPFVCLCSLVPITFVCVSQIPLCLVATTQRSKATLSTAWSEYPSVCVLLQQLAVLKQPCLQPHCLCLFAACSEYPPPPAPPPPPPSVSHCNNWPF